MIQLLQRTPPLKRFAGFITSHIIKQRKTDEVDNYVACKKRVTLASNIIATQLHYALPHSILCVVHNVDYIIRDWRAVPVFPLLYNELMRCSVRVDFLTQIRIFDPTRKRFTVTHRIGGGKQRPWFPFRQALDATFFLVRRDADATYKKWQSSIDIAGTIKLINVWRDQFMGGSASTPTVYIYKSILDMFCHPEAVIYDPLPHTGEFAAAAKMLNREYVGVYKNQKRLDAITDRLIKLEDSMEQQRNGRDSVRTFSASNRRLVQQKAHRVLGWGSGER